MKKLLIMALVATMAAAVQTARANDNMTVDEKMSKLDSKLDLSADQEAQIRPIVQQKKDGTITKDDFDRQVRAILTPDQQTKFDAMKDEKHHQKNQKKMDRSQNQNYNQNQNQQQQQTR